MLFFDDKKQRIKEGVLAGVTSIHCPDGLTGERFVTGVQEFNAKRLKSKEQTIILVRHAQGFHNVDEDWSIIDPELTKKGHEQALGLRGCEQFDGAELLVVSPL